MDSCKDPEYFACLPCQSAVASRGMFAVDIAGIEDAAGPGNCIIAEIPAEVLVGALAEAFAVEGPAAHCSGRTGSTAVLAAVVVEGVAGNHYHRKPARLVAA